MLIRSQDKAFLLNFNNLTVIYMEKIDKDFAIVYNDFEDAYTLGKYSSEAKSMKVLDMIQEAYAEYEMLLQTFMGIASVYVTTTEKEILDKKKKDIKKKAIFQMPQDSEVEE